MSEFENVSVSKTANVYFDGKCISRLVLFPDGKKVTLGVIFPSALKFSAKCRETMMVLNGKCRVRLDESEEWVGYAAGGQFEVPGNTSFEILVEEMVEYICHYHEQS